jgi:hypothetical protein
MTNKKNTNNAKTIYNADLPPLDADFKKELNSWLNADDKAKATESTLSDRIRGYMVDGLAGKQQLEQAAYFLHLAGRSESYRALINRLTAELFNKGKVKQMVVIKSSRKGAKKEIVPVVPPTKEQAEQKIVDLAEKARDRQQKQAEEYMLCTYNTLDTLRAEFARIEALLTAKLAKAS